MFVSITEVSIAFLRIRRVDVSSLVYAVRNDLLDNKLIRFVLSVFLIVGRKVRGLVLGFSVGSYVFQ